MRIFLIFTFLILSIASVNGESTLTGPYELDEYETFMIMAREGKLRVQVDNHQTYGCWKSYEYKVLSDHDKNEFLIIKRPLAHIQILCNDRKTIEEGVELLLDKSDLYYIHVPKGIEVKIIDGNEKAKVKKCLDSNRCLKTL